MMSAPAQPNFPDGLVPQARALLAASRAILAGRDLADWVVTTLRAAPGGVAGVAITHWGRPLAPDAPPSQLRRIAVMAHDAAPVELPPDLPPAGDRLAALARGEVITQQAETDAPLFMVGDQVVRWTASFGLHTGDGSLLGILELLSDAPAALTPEDRWMVALVAEQIGVALHNRDLIHQTRAALDEVRTLYDVNRAILSAQDTLDVLRALRRHLAPEALLVSHLRVNYDANRRIESILLDFLSLPDGEQAVELPLHQMIAPYEFERLEDEWNRRDEIVTFVGDLSVPDADDPLANFSRQNGLLSYVTFSLRESGRVREAITIGFSTPQVFDAARRRLYEALGDQIAIVLQAHRLLRETQVAAEQLAHQVQTLQIINQFASQANVMEDEQTLLNIACRTLVQATGADHAGIMLLEPDGASGIVAAEFPERSAVGARIDVTANPLYQRMSANDPRPVVVHDAQHTPELDESTRQVMARLGVQALLIAPLFVHGRFSGSVGLDLYTPGRRFTPEVIELARALAAQVASGLQNLRLLAEARRRADQLQRIASFSQSVQATLDLESVFTVMLTETARMLPQDQVSISLYDPARGALRTVAALAGGAVSVGLAGGDTIPLSGHIAAVWETWELLYLPDLHAATDRPESALRAWMLAPIVSRGRILGIVSVGSLRPYSYSDTDVALFQQMVNQLAVSIENTQAYEQSQRMVKNEALVNAIAMRVQQHTDLSRIMDVAVQELGQALGARRARIRLRTETDGEAVGE